MGGGYGISSPRPTPSCLQASALTGSGVAPAPGSSRPGPSPAQPLGRVGCDGRPSGVEPGAAAGELLQGIAPCRADGQDVSRRLSPGARERHTPRGFVRRTSPAKQRPPRSSWKPPPIPGSPCCSWVLVREGGLEPPRLAPHAPQTCLSASSSTLARARSEPGAAQGGTGAPQHRQWCRRGDLNPHRLAPTAP